MEPDERSTIERALSGAPEDFEAVIRDYSRRVYAVAYGVLQDTAEAEDAAQETFLKAFRQRGRLRDPEKFPAWLFSIARHCACDALRKRRTAPAAEPPVESADDSQPAPGASLEQAELRQNIHTALAALPENHRVALTLRYLEGMDPRSIETAMGLSNGALRGILGRGLATLRKTLSGAQPFLRS
jgi:RNA polymerase sigma-70 factor, ECF subfamily